MIMGYSNAPQSRSVVCRHVEEHVTDHIGHTDQHHDRVTPLTRLGPIIDGRFFDALKQTITMRGLV